MCPLRVVPPQQNDSRPPGFPPWTCLSREHPLNLIHSHLAHIELCSLRYFQECPTFKDDLWSPSLIRAAHRG